MQRLLRGDGARLIRKFSFSRTTWIWEEGHLDEISIGAVIKTLRRALDVLREPSTVAVGTITPSWESGQWHLSAHVIVSVLPEIDVWRAFDNTISIAGSLEVQLVTDVKAELNSLFHEAELNENVAADLPRRKLRREYYCWLAELKAGGRVFRYGCDRHFNPLQKAERQLRQKSKKGHPNPIWLNQYQFGNHPWTCQCIPCQGLGNNVGPSKKALWTRVPCPTDYFDLDEETDAKKRPGRRKASG